MALGCGAAVAHCDKPERTCIPTAIALGCCPAVDKRMYISMEFKEQKMEIGGLHCPIGQTAGTEILSSVTSGVTIIDKVLFILEQVVYCWMGSGFAWRPETLPMILHGIASVREFIITAPLHQCEGVPKARASARISHKQGNLR